MKYEVITQVTISMSVEIEAPSPKKAEDAVFETIQSALDSIKAKWRYESVEGPEITPIA